MRMFVTFFIAVFCNAILLTDSWPGSALVDEEGIESSRAGLPFREASRFISVLEATPTGWMEDDLSEDRQQCRKTKDVLDGAKRLHLKGELTQKAIHRLVKKAGMSPFCLMSLSSSQDQESEEIFLLLLSPEGDIVFFGGSSGPYKAWSEIDHQKAAFDTLSLDDWTTLGIAPSVKELVQEEYVTVGTQQMKVERYWPPQVLPNTAPIPPSR